MTTVAKVLVPNKFWILENDGEKFAINKLMRVTWIISNYYVRK